MEWIRRTRESLLGGDEDEQDDDYLGESGNNSFSLTRIQRIYGFVICLVVGLLFMFLSLLVFYRPIKFALLFTFGNILALGSTAFLIGPLQQLRMMFDPVRMYASAIYVGFLLLALLCALGIHNKLLTLVAIICEVCAFIWYSLSYIPFARRLVSDVMIRLFDTEI